MNTLQITNDIAVVSEAKSAFLEEGLTRVIKGAIVQKGWNKQRFAEATGIAQSTISVLLAGGDKNRCWTIKQLVRVAMALGISLTDLVSAAESGEELSSLMIDLAGTEPASKERLTRIIRTLAAKGTVQDVLDLYFTADMMAVSVPEYVKEYLNGEIDDRSVYEVLTRVNENLAPEENLWGKLSAFMSDAKLE
jgi:DNA-binding Xre family transcriptional regulator